MGKFKILIAEDEKDICAIYDAALPSEVFEKQFCANGAEALQLYDTWRPEIMVLDIYMPLMTGYDVLKTIREQYQDRNTTIVMSTSLSGQNDVLSCVKLGIDGYIIKPLDCANVGRRIFQYHQKRTQQEPATQSNP